MDDFEEGCRRALRWYPRRWRDRHGDALLGILLDQADAEGRTRMSPEDRRDLARRGLVHRLRPVLVVVLVVLSGLALLQLAGLLLFRTELDAQLWFSPPPLHPVPVGTGRVPLLTLSFSGWAAYSTCVIVALGAAASAAVVVRRTRTLR